MRITTWRNKPWTFGIFLSRWMISIAIFHKRVRIEPYRDKGIVFHNSKTGKVRIPKQSKGSAKVNYDV